MHDVATIPAMTTAAIGQVRALETAAGEKPQIPIETIHTFHAGLYGRTVMIPASVLITGTLIKIPTVLIVSGHAIMYRDGGPIECEGYHVFSASASRKQAFLAITDTYLTMLFATEAKTVEEAEREFTDETDLLSSRRDGALNTLAEVVK